MPTLENIEHDVLYSLFKGEPNTTKSSQALTWPKPQYWLSWDGKMQALARAMKHHGVKGEDISFDNYENWDSPRKKLESFQLNCPFKTIVVDSITSGSDYILRQVRKSKSGSTRASGAAAGKSIAGIETNELEDFNAEAAALSELVALTKYLFEYKRINIILIGHVIRTEQKSLDGKINITRQLVTAAKKVASKIPAYCTEIYHFDIEPSLTGGQGKINMRTTSSSEDYARTSLPLPGLIELGYDNLYEKYVLPAIKELKA